MSGVGVLVLGAEERIRAGVSAEGVLGVGKARH